MSLSTSEPEAPITITVSDILTLCPNSLVTVPTVPVILVPKVEGAKRLRWTDLPTWWANNEVGALSVKLFLVDGLIE
jgi:hypothetical protein